MHGMRRHPMKRSGHSFLGLLSVLALLALACFVPMAQAVADSSGIEYRDATPSATGEIPTKEVPATTSKNKGGAQSPGDSNNTSESEKDSSKEEAGSGGVTGGNGGGTGQGGTGSQQGNPAAGSKAGKIAVAHALLKSPAEESGDSSSSPLVPILIALAAVMAIAIAVVVIRQRRQRGGPDGHVSPEAS